MVQLRIKGQEYGPYTKEQLLAYLDDRDWSEDVDQDAVLDPEIGNWITITEWLPEEEEEEEQVDYLDKVTIPSVYSRVTKAGVALFLLFLLIFIAIRLETGKWPGQGAPPHVNPVVSEGTKPQANH
ncbi:MAG: hypothetical protein JKX97_06805 [Candidatus Lindowbacteria bacterium]|nr:hypothetical protein [Candidatus Lindowbacteria bacterium]